jgi:transcriptional regulator with XRE-family HTH domain
MESMSPGLRIKQLRLLAGLSQSELAEESGMSLRSIQRIENGNTLPRGDSLKRISKALNVHVETLTTHLDIHQAGDMKTLKEDPKIPLIIILSAFGYLWNPLLGLVFPTVLWTLFRNSTNNVQQIGIKVIRLQLLYCLILALVYSYIMGQKLSIFDLPVPGNGKSIQLFITGMYIANALAIFGLLIGWTRMQKRLQNA